MAPGAGASSISVTVRVRPFTIREAAQLADYGPRSRTDDSTVFLGDGSLAAAPAPKLHQRGLRSVIKVVDDRCLVFDPPEDNPVQKFSRSVVPTGKKVKDQVFAFDRIFDDNVTQTEVYEGTTKGLLDSVLDGYNATVFAYGATGCGKTHTITGTPQQPGIIFLTMQELFEKIQERSDEKVTEVSLSYLEIYNETIRDLLVPGGSKQGLTLREDLNHAVTVAGLTSHHPKDVQEVMDMIVQGNEYRTVSPTEANATSSRSHAVLQINVAQRDRNADISEPHTMATLSIIDLAGSERASATKNRGERLMEGANINKSLLALGSCINALCDPRKRNHVPYRNSKLTRLLKFSLGGNCKTVMIVCVSPSSAHFDETQNTLRYANRAKNIQTKVTRNVFNVNRHVKDFLVKIDEQMALINELKAQQKDAEKIFFAKFRKQTEKKDATAREGVQRLRAAYENAQQQRQEKIASLKRLKAFERRISLLEAWLSSFDAVCESRGASEEDMPDSLRAIQKTANGILAELQTSRHHLHRKLENSNWERAIDTALQHSIRLLPDGENAANSSQISTLQREAEVLKTNFAKEMYREVLEQEKGADKGTMEVLLTAQLEIISSLSDTLSMSQEDAVAHAKSIIHKMLESGVAAANYAVRPDSAPPKIEVFAPSKRGTPKKKRAPREVSSESAFLAPTPTTIELPLSPIKGSPKRRKAPVAARKPLTFTPKKKSPSKRSVRWRDDEEDGTLVEFQRTPQPYESTPEVDSPAPKHTPPSPIGFRPQPVETIPEIDSDSSPSLEIPESTITLGKPNRFQAGFLSKGARSSNSPVLVAPSLSLNLANVASSSSSPSDSEERSVPLRSLDVARSSNLSPPGAAAGRPSRIASPPVARRSLDENHPPENAGGHSSGSESESPSNLDARKIASAMHSAKRHSVSARRLSSLSGSTASSAAKRGIVPVERASGHRPSLSLPTISSNGISRHRRNSGERRKSPPISCSPPEARSATRAFTAGQARRMNLGGSVRMEASPGIRDAGAELSRNRRVTISGMASRASRPSLAWR
ncbi:hypothetical protein jhhlp_005302 [Lomentospora prolificans]|uniref:Kinesin motor domain-containing protein n=1 Tax=Lomentospora prolificans TaxID=41688 RepID=A0A2N3N7E5_9PEZI|nr:hypothetical protein jhhlp_005302 [Lomentospora prolificans]